MNYLNSNGKYEEALTVRVICWSILKLWAPWTWKTTLMQFHGQAEMESYDCLIG